MEYDQGGAGRHPDQITAWNRGPEEAQLDLLPTMWFRNIWSFGGKHGHPKLWRIKDYSVGTVRPPLSWPAQESRYGTRWLLAEGAPEMLSSPKTKPIFSAYFNFPNATPYVKDSFHDFLVHGARGAVNPAQLGTKCAAHYRARIAPRGVRNTPLAPHEQRSSY